MPMLPCCMTMTIFNRGRFSSNPMCFDLRRSSCGCMRRSRGQCHDRRDPPAKDFSGYKVVVLPVMQIMDRSLAQRLRAFVTERWRAAHGLS